MEFLDYHGCALQNNDVCRLREEGGYVRISQTPEGKFFYVEIEDASNIWQLSETSSQNLELIYRH
jgi:hypothetical protein